MYMFKKELYGLDIGDTITELESEFSPQQVTAFLLEVELLPKWTNCLEERFEKFVFLNGNQDEVYSSEERKFIKDVDIIYIYPEFHKKTKKGNMACHIFAADLSDNKDFVKTGVTFMKIINKSVPGFSIFLLKLFDGMHLGCRIFDQIDWKDCTLSEVDTLDQIVDQIYYIDEQDEFISYYTMFTEAIMPKDNWSIDYDEKVRNKTGIDIGYLSILNQLEKGYGISVEYARTKYVNSFNNKEQSRYKYELDECLEELRYIKSNKLNTIEILFEAEEMEMLAIDSYQRSQKIVDAIKDEDNKSIDLQLLEKYKNDPEAVIKILKSQHGIN